MTSEASRNPELARLLVYLGQVGKPLSADIQHAEKQLQLSHDRFVAGRQTLQEVCFWGKAVATSLFGHMDALGFAARKTTVLFRSLGGLSLTNKELAHLSEVRYDRVNDQLTRIPSLLNPVEGFKTGVKYFCRLLGADFELAVGDERWNGVVDLWRSRCRYTHPKRIEDLYAVELFGPLKSSLVWYHSELLRMFSACARSLGLPHPEPEPVGRVRPIRVTAPAMFSEDDLEQQIVVGGRSVAYITNFLRLLSYDSNRASLARKRVKKRTGELSAFVNRLLVRVECTRIEALLSALRFLLHAARRRQEVSFSDDELHSVPGHPIVVGELLAALRVWARTLGPERAINLTPQTLAVLAEAWEQRDRLIHPTNPAALEVSTTKALHFSLGFSTFELEVLKAMELDQGKSLEAYERGRSLREARGSAPSSQNP